MADRPVIKAALQAAAGVTPNGLRDVSLQQVLAILEAVDPIIRADERRELARVARMTLDPTDPNHDEAVAIATEAVTAAESEIRTGERGWMHERVYDLLNEVGNRSPDPQWRKGAIAALRDVQHYLHMRDSSE